MRSHVEGLIKTPPTLEALFSKYLLSGETTLVALIVNKTTNIFRDKCENRGCGLKMSYNIYLCHIHQ
jgi:hypothetical protein